MAQEKREAKFEEVFDLAHLANPPEAVVCSNIVHANLLWLQKRGLACEHVFDLTFIVEIGHSGLTVLWTESDVEAYLLSNLTIMNNENQAQA